MAGGNYGPAVGSSGSGIYGSGVYADAIVGFLAFGVSTNYTINVSIGTQASVITAGSASTRFRVWTH